MPTFVVRSNITSIGHLTFSSCPKLKKFIIEDSENELSCGMFNMPLSEDKLDYMYVGRPFDHNAEGWKNFFDIRENDGTITKINNVTKAKTATATSYYNLSGQAVSKDYKGVVIVRSSDGSSKKVLNK